MNSVLAPAAGLLPAGAELPRPRVIGMLGGMSWESTAEYYRLANELVRDRLGGLHSARLVLASVDFAEIEALQVAGEWDRGRRAPGRRGRPAGGRPARSCCCCAPTPCTRSPTRCRPPSSIPLLHLGRRDGRGRARTQGCTTVGLLGTAFTMEQDFYRDRLAAHGLAVLVPAAADRAEVHRIIYDELCLGVVREESREAVPARSIERLVAAGAQGVILGCTEIELLVGPADSPVPVFPTTRLHVEAAVSASLQPSAPSRRAE